MPAVEVSLKKTQCIIKALLPLKFRGISAQTVFLSFPSSSGLFSWSREVKVGQWVGEGGLVKISYVLATVFMRRIFRNVVPVLML